MKSKVSNNIPLISLAIALTLIFTSVFSFPFLLATGYINLGDSIIFIFSSLLPPFLSAFVAATGSGLADLFLGYSFYIPATILAKGLMGFVFSILFRKRKFNNWINFIIAGALMILIYFVFETIIYDIKLAALNLVGNFVQLAVNSVLAKISIQKISKAHIDKYI